MALLFLCMTIKIRLELRLLDSSRASADFPANNKTHISENVSDSKSGGASLNTINEKNLVSVAPKYNSSLVNENVNKDMKKSGNTSTKLGDSRRLSNAQTGPQNPKTHGSVKKDIFAKLGILVDSKEIRNHKLSTENTKTSAKARDSKTKESQPRSEDNEKTLPGSTNKAVQNLRPVIENSPTKAKETPSSRNKGKPIKTKEVAALLQQKPFPPDSQRKAGGSYNIAKKGVSHDVDSTEVSLTKEDIAKIKKQLKIENEQQKVYNEERYGHILSNTSILLVQVSYPCRFYLFDYFPFCIYIYISFFTQTCLFPP